MIGLNRLFTPYFLYNLLSYTMKFILYIFCTALTIGVLAQSPEPFRGGGGDGLARANKAQSSIDFWRGAGGDGHSNIPFSQQSVAFWLGGNGDGYAKNGYASSSTGFMLGGGGDGYANRTYTQASLSFWLGGNGDGYAQKGHLQSSVSFWLGGSGDGYADSGYAQQSVAFWLGGGGDGWASSYRPEGPLPVQFGSFSAEKKNDTQALLHWHTISESNSSHFEIERSSNAVTFYPIGKVNAAGTSSSPKYYHHTDAKVLTGYNYYRIKQVDKNGNFVYTPTRMLQFDAPQKGNFMAYPNPAGSYVVVASTVPAGTGRVVINLADANGRMVKQWKLPEGLHSPVKLNLQGFAKGIYVLHIVAENQQSVQKLMIQ
jgi:hypothetical protein